MKSKILILNELKTDFGVVPAGTTGWIEYDGAKGSVSFEGIKGELTLFGAMEDPVPKPDDPILFKILDFISCKGVIFQLTKRSYDERPGNVMPVVRDSVDT
jgi:hypothetical protein